MSDLIASSLVLLLLGMSAAAGRVLVRLLPEDHRSRETLDFTRLASSLLVTFTALVLSLLLTTVNGDFRKTDADLHTFASMITLLDGEMEAFGPGTDHARSILRDYTASAIASTWPGETPPPGDYPTSTAHGDDIDSLALGRMLRQVETEIRRLKAATPEQDRVQTTCLVRIAALLDERWSLIGEAHSTLSPPFLAILLFWLVIVFLNFGMTSPPNAVSAVTVGLVGVSVAAALFVILELDGPLDGLIKVGSEPLRHALRHLTSFHGGLPTSTND